MRECACATITAPQPSRSSVLSLSYVIFSLSLSQFCSKLFKNVNLKHYIDDVECACTGDEASLPSICILLNSLYYITLYFST